MRLETVVLIRLSVEDQMRLADAGAIELDQAMSGAGFIEHRLPAHSDECRRFIEELEARGVEFWVHDERHFDRREIREATALRCRPSPRIASTGLPTEVQMDWSEVCPHCMRVPEQKGQLVVSPFAVMGLVAAWGPRGEFIVDEETAMRMIKEGVTGCLLREVRFGDEAPAPETTWFQVLVTSNLPPAASPPTRFLTSPDQCEVCYQGGLHLDSLLFYDLDEESLDDVNATYELFGEGSGIAPELVLSPRFYNLLLSCGAALEEPEPIQFI